MSTDSTIVQVEYPESDGEPMGESDVHRKWMVRIIEMLEWHLRGERTYVTGNLLVYYVEGDPTKVISPDAMVVKDCDTHERPIYKLWEERRTPCFVLETSSKTTKSVDLGKKWRLYADLGIAEYFLFDPTGDYLKERLVGHRLDGESYVRIELDTDGCLESAELGLRFQMLDDYLHVYSTASGQEILPAAERAVLSDLEAAEANHAKMLLARKLQAESIRADREAEERQAAEAARQAAEAARQAAETARQAAEAEVARLRAELARRPPAES